MAEDDLGAADDYVLENDEEEEFRRARAAAEAENAQRRAEAGVTIYVMRRVILYNMQPVTMPPSSSTKIYRFDQVNSKENSLPVQLGVRGLILL